MFYLLRLQGILVILPFTAGIYWLCLLTQGSVESINPFKLYYINMIALSYPLECA